MRIRMLAVQYKQAYPGELAPNILAVTDEYLDDTNPTYFDDAVAKELEKIGEDVEAHAILELDVPTDQITAALNPVHRVDATVVTDGN